MEEQKSIKFRQNFMFNFPEDLYNKFMSSSNRTELLTQLVQNYFDENMISVKLDKHTRDMLKNDVYGDFRIQMLLMEFYSKGNIDSVVNYNSIKVDSVNNTERYNNEVTAEEIVEKKELILEKDVHNNSESTIEKAPDTEEKSAEIISNDESVTNENINTGDIISDNNEIALTTDNNLVIEEEKSEKNNTIVSHNKKAVSRHKNENDDLQKVPDNAVGSIADMFKNKNVLKNNKNLI